VSPGAVRPPPVTPLKNILNSQTTSNSFSRFVVAKCCGRPSKSDTFWQVLRVYD